MKVHTIEPSLLYQRGKMHAHSLTAKAELAEQYNLRVVIGLAPRRQDEGWRRLSMARSGLIYVFRPVADGLVGPEHELLVELAEEIARTAAGPVLTHCNAGRNRASLMSALLLRHWFGITGREAAEHVKAKRPNALANEHFVAFLEGLGPGRQYAPPFRLRRQGSLL